MHQQKGELREPGVNSARAVKDNMIYDKVIAKYNPYHNKKLEEYEDTRYDKNHLKVIG